MRFHPLRLKPSHLFDIKTAEPVRRRCDRGERWKSERILNGLARAGFLLKNREGAYLRASGA